MSLAVKANSKSSVVNEPVVLVVHPWDLVVTETEVILVPKPVPYRGIVVLCGLFILFCGLMALPVVIWGDPEVQRQGPIIISIFAAFMCMVFTVIIVFMYRTAQHEGPPLRIDRVGNTVHVLKHDLSVPIDQVDYLEVRNDMPDEDGNYQSEDHCSSELLLIVRGEENPKRYSLVFCTAQDYYDPLAREIAVLDILPVKRVKGVPGSKLVYEKWLTPEPPEDQI